jgi:hypothetical protein
VPAVVPAASDLQRQLDDLRAERDRLLGIIETLAARPPAVPQIAQAAEPKRGRVGRAIDALRGR